MPETIGPRNRLVLNRDVHKGDILLIEGEGKRKTLTISEIVTDSRGVEYLSAKLVEIVQQGEHPKALVTSVVVMGAIDQDGRFIQNELIQGDRLLLYGPQTLPNQGRIEIEVKSFDRARS